MKDKHNPRCICREDTLGENTCHSNDVCECQISGDDSDLVFCGQDEIEEFKRKREELKNCEKMEPKYLNKGTNEMFSDIGDMVLDAQKRYAILQKLVYCDIECVIKNPDSPGEYYILDECGNWEYFPSNYYEIIPPIRQHNKQG